MQTWKYVCICVALAWLGCGDGIGADGGVGLDGGSDSGRVPLCARDSECSDGLFCTGEERCRPGDAEADARGCITLSVPCVPGACDEVQDVCQLCAPEMRNLDGDGFDSIACGGTDCDDNNGSVYPGAVEVCDSGGVDEDCNPLTLGIDADSDGAYRSDCCYQPPEGELVCGTDCDDGNPSIGPDSPERCNGVDDDCDGLIDEDFECIQSQTEYGANICGREGSRACGASCTWTGTVFQRAEGAATCDYCDDSGLGLGEEIPYATRDLVTSVDVIEWELYGDTGACIRPPPLPSVANCVRLVSSSEHRGGAYAPDLLALGYGATRISATVRTTAIRTSSCSGPLCTDHIGGYWALVLLTGAPSHFVGNGTATLPQDDGMAVQWSFASRNPLFTASDSLSIMRLIYGGDPLAIASSSAGVEPRQDGFDRTPIDQEIAIEIISDDPRTATDDSSLTIVSPSAVALRCANDGTADHCGITFAPGLVFRVGLAAAGNPSGDVIVSLDGEMIMTVSSEGLCPALP